jgi:hypothetical protein
VRLFAELSQKDGWRLRAACIFSPVASLAAAAEIIDGGKSEGDSVSGLLGIRRLSPATIDGERANNVDSDRS